MPKVDDVVGSGLASLASQRDAAERDGLSCAFAVMNRESGKVFVASTWKGAAAAWESHLAALRAGKHAMRHLQAAFKKYGEGAFSICAVVPCDAADIHAEEDKLVDRLGSKDQKRGYN